jgi:hypothetical protein
MILLILVGIFCLGCEEFSPQSLVEKLRILGIRVEPPEPRPDEKVIIEALYADPRGKGRKIDFSWCMCMIDKEEDPQKCIVPGSGMCIPEDSPRMEFKLPKEVGEMLRQSLKGEITITLFLRIYAQGEEAIAIKRIPVSNKNKERNLNPKIIKIMMNGEVLEVEEEINRESKFYFKAEVSQPEEYIVYVHGRPESRKEELLLSWYATSGKWQHIRSSTNMQNVWTSPAHPQEVSMYFVLRDGRGGIHWLTKSIKVK